jgi:hypothetical protein
MKVKIMTKSKTNHPASATSSSSSSVADQLGAIEAGLATVNSLTAKQRDTLRSRSRSVPDTLIQMVIQLATKNGGQVAGIPFDVDAAQATLAQVSDAEASAGTSRTIAQKLEDGSLQQRIVVADRVFAIYRALGRLVKTPEGNSILGTYEEMTSTVRNQPRLRRKKAAEASSASPSTETAPAQSPAPAPSPVPAAAPAPATAQTQATVATAAGGAIHP